jgi:hypothetical protein
VLPTPSSAYCVPYQAQEVKSLGLRDSVGKHRHFLGSVPHLPGRLEKEPEAHETAVISRLGLPACPLPLAQCDLGLLAVAQTPAPANRPPPADPRLPGHLPASPPHPPLAGPLRQQAHHLAREPHPGARPLHVPSQPRLYPSEWPRLTIQACVSRGMGRLGTAPGRSAPGSCRVRGSWPRVGNTGIAE